MRQCPSAAAVNINFGRVKGSWNEFQSAALYVVFGAIVLLVLAGVEGSCLGYTSCQNNVRLVAVESNMRTELW